MKNPWKKLSSKIAYRNPWFKVREDKVIRPNGKRGIYSVIETNGPSVYVVAMTDKDEVYLVRQYRYTTGSFLWEIIGGNSDGETPLAAAKRELQEEAGLVAKRWQEVGKFQVENGIGSEIGYVFIARELKMAISNKMTEEGIDELKKVPFKKALAMIESEEITDGQSIVALTKANLWLRRNEVNP